ncbi:MAG TPA: hypothetical protein VF505_13695 [Thermoanaerobaculia bacterium]
MINIHNGDAMLVYAKREGFPGEHITFRESLVAGPVVATADWLSTRAHFLANAFREELLRTSNSLFEQEQALNAAAEQDEIVLWFEHDLFCLVNFLYLLNRFRERNVSFIWCSDPLALREAADLGLLFESRTPATPAVFDIAARAWGAYTSSDPRLLNDAITSTPNDLPFLREGLTLHASRFPSVRNGLGSVENRLLSVIAGGASDFGTLFPLFDEKPPRFGFGDAQVLYVLRYLASRPVPVITMAEAHEGPPKATFAITPAGQNVLAGKVDDTTVNDPDFWLGGVHLTKENLWRWDEARGEILPSRLAAF